MLPSRDSGCKVTAFFFVYKELRLLFFCFLCSSHKSAMAITISRLIRVTIVTQLRQDRDTTEAGS